MRLLTIKFSISLGFLTILNLPTLAAESQQWEIELQQKVYGFGIKTLFINHQLPKNMEEVGDAEAAYSKAERMLSDKQGVKALPYLAYAEHYMVPDSIRVLREIACGAYRGIPENIREQIKQKLSKSDGVFSGRDNQVSLLKIYVDYWDKNEKNLRNSQQTSFFNSVKKLILGDNPSFPHTKPMQSISSEAFSGKQSKTSPYSSTREGTAEDMISLLLGDLEGKIKEE
ncbi:hypothetical protein [Candidatus Odyssella acanthamoebae]|uniref:Uncharacterized protein n=1 Tax=Candidatus Odyssella acanthamoebae TaxID=91604 RepID=A0A077AVN8_9PROT|nr:hypothetical protein [Candidatus Paracaedibacter acanthamoebae]AIK96109.1 hypothetical protein ID47_04175 [Candidatus Paracaedibacter acanthamoebae]